MRIRLLTMSIVDRVLYALNLKVAETTTIEADVRRTALLGDEHSISEQTLRSRRFAEEVAVRKLNKL